MNKNQGYAPTGSIPRMKLAGLTVAFSGFILQHFRQADLPLSSARWYHKDIAMKFSSFY
jgi:hypothetical protein